jgi:hypothetical protein
MRRDAVTFGDSRLCWVCKQLLPLSSYSPKKGSATERHYVCKACCNSRAKAWYARNRERGKAARLAWATALRSRAIEAIGGWICACCGENRRSMIDVDHIHGGGGKHRRERGNLGYYHDIIADPSKYQVLCCNCNHSKRRLGECEHKCPSKAFIASPN